VRGKSLGVAPGTTSATLWISRLSIALNYVSDYTTCSTVVKPLSADFFRLQTPAEPGCIWYGIGTDDGRRRQVKRTDSRAHFAAAVKRMECSNAPFHKTSAWRDHRHHLSHGAGGNAP
jgi:hypothetical protein